MQPGLLTRYAHVHVQKRWRVCIAILLLSSLLYLYGSMITMKNEIVELGNSNVFKDADFSTQHPLLKIQDYLTGPLVFVYNEDVHQSKVHAKFKPPFIVQEHELYLRLFVRPHYKPHYPRSSVCDREALAAYGHKKKRIVFYNPPDWPVTDYNMSYCECSHCEIVYSNNITHADIVFFHGVRLSIKQPPERPRGQIWVAVGSEAPIYYTGLLHTAEWRGVFNWTSTHRVDSDIFHPYGMLLQKNDTRKSRKFFESLAKSKTKMAVAVISHCETKSLRAEYIEELQRYMDVDMYGFCGIKTTCHKKNATCYSELVKPYTFVLAFENAFCEDYVTEKFFRAFKDDFFGIPVVRGGTDYHRYFPNGTFIDAADFNSPKDLARYLNKIGKNHTKVADMLEAKFRYYFLSTYNKCPICYLLLKYNITSSGIGPSVSAVDRAALTKTYSDVFNWLLQDKCFTPHDVTRAPENL